MSDASLPYLAGAARYQQMSYRRAGRSGLELPGVSLGLWHNFGSDRAFTDSRAVLLRAFDLGVTHFDVANNYGPPPGSAESGLGAILASDLRPYRDELVISTKAGYEMWPGPYGRGGARKHLLASLDQSLTRLGLDHVDIFYSHRLDPTVPLEETMGALAHAVQQGKATYVGVSSYSAERTRQAWSILRELGVSLVLHQPSYSMFNRWIEADLLSALDEMGVGCVGFSALAQGLLTDRYLSGIPAGSRASGQGSLHREMLSETNLIKIRALNEIARGRGQTLAQMAIAWVLRDHRITSALIGASNLTQLEANLGALTQLQFSDEELAAIDRYATESNVNIWAESSRY